MKENRSSMGKFQKGKEEKSGKLNKKSGNREQMVKQQDNKNGHEKEKVKKFERNNGKRTTQSKKEEEKRKGIERNGEGQIGIKRNETEKKGAGRNSIGKKDIERSGIKRDSGRGRKRNTPCPVYEQCGGCQLLHLPYKEQLAKKQKMVEELLKGICPVKPIIGMKEPLHYRNKVHAVFGHDKKGNPISGVYKEGTHILTPVESCLIEDKKADEIIGTIRGMLKSFKIRTFDEDTGYGFLRHVLVRRGFATGEIMVVLVTASPVFPSKNNFIKALREKHPEITTIIQNLNGRNTSMVLGNKEHVLYGKGYIEDVLCGLRFRISSKSFYQVNSVQTEILYTKALELARLTGKEKVLDAYCGIGTIGLIASGNAGQVIGVELNPDAVRDAVQNAKMNNVKNIQFYCNDASKFMVNMAENGEKVDVVLMDPPRSGSTKEFIDSVAKLGPDRVVYISCGPETLVRDLKMFEKKGYRAKVCWCVDLFVGTNHVESVVLMSRVQK